MDDCFRGDKNERNTKNNVPDESTPRLRRLIQKKETALFEQLLHHRQRHCEPAG
jgi:hypothetical protein